MQILKLKNIKLERELIDKEACFRLGYCKEINSYVAVVLQSWIVDYERWHMISADDYALYQANRESFLLQWKWMLAHCLPTPLSASFIGANAIRDYDCRDDITRILPVDDNPFQGHVFIHGMLWARICTGTGVLLTPPKRQTCSGYPMREIPGVRLVHIEINGEMHALCYGIPESEVVL